MKTFISILLLFSLNSFIYAEQVSPSNQKICVSGPIDTYTYLNDFLYIHVRGYNFELFTQNTFIIPLIISAYNKNMNVVIYTNSCCDGGEFTKIKFNSTVH